MFGQIVDAFHHRVLERDGLALLAFGIACACGHQFGDRIFLVEWHQLRAQLVGRRVQRYREGDIGFLGQTIDHRHQSGGRQRDALVGEAEAKIVAHDAHRTHHIVEIQQRLAHAHHHHVGELALAMRHVVQMFRCNPHLADDLRSGQVAVEALRAGRAERASQAAADLRRDAQCAATLVGNEHRFDRVAAVHAEQPFVGAIGGWLLELHARRRDHTGRLQLRSQRLAKIGHLLEIGRVAMIDPLHHLLGAITLLAEGREEFDQPVTIEVE